MIPTAALLRALLLFSLLAPPCAALAQAWPAKTVRIILGGSPGGTPDIASRLLADRYTRVFGRQFLVENVTGAGGIAAAQLVAKAAPDGYTLLFALNSQLVSNLYTYKSLPYDPAKDFIPVAMVVDTAPFVIAVNAEVRADNLPQLLAAAREQPGKLSYAITAANATAGIAGEWLNHVAGVKMVQVPYKITAQAIQDTVAGRTEVIIISPAVIQSFVKAGKLRFIAVTSARRLPGMDDVATVGETVPGFQVGGWFALMAPAGTPAEIVQHLNREADAFLKDEEVAQRLRQMSMAGSGAGTPQSIAAQMRAERELWARIVKDLDIKPE